jgi:hypothetical protein
MRRKGMAEVSPAMRTIRLRLICEAAPPKEHANRPTEFGLEDKKLQLHPGLEHPDGSVQFDLEVQVQSIGPTGTHRFYGPFVQGKPGEQKLHLHWKYTDEPQNIRGQGVPLYTITEKMIGQVTRRTPGILQAKVLPITERTATIPVEWTVLPGSE